MYVFHEIVIQQSVEIRGIRGIRSGPFTKPLMSCLLVSHGRRRENAMLDTKRGPRLKSII
jgi:hypothetical protein